MKDRKELFCGTENECQDFVVTHPKEREMEILRNACGPAFSVFFKRKRVDKTIKAPVRRLTRASFPCKGGARQLWVSLEPGDVLTFCPKGTRQKVSVPIAHAYGAARFSAARAIVNAKRAAKKKGGR